MMLSRDFSLSSPRRTRSDWKGAYEVNTQVPVFVADYVTHVFGTDRRARFTDLHVFSRASHAWAPDSSGAFARFAIDTPRLIGQMGVGTQQGLLIEPASRNALSNPEMTGGALGPLDAGGALPAGWALQGIAPADVTVLSFAPIGGLPACRLRLQAASTAGDIYIFFNERTELPAVANQPWQVSAYLAAPEGAPTGVDRIRLYGIGWTSAGSFVSGSTRAFKGANLVGTLTSSPVRHAVSGHLTGSACERLQPTLRIDTGGSIDLTLDIAMVQVEEGAQTSSPLPTPLPRAPDIVGVKWITGNYDVRVSRGGATTDYPEQYVSDGYWPADMMTGLFRKLLIYPQGTL